MNANDLLAQCASIDALSTATLGKIKALQHHLKQLPDGSGLKVVLLAQIDRLKMANHEITQSADFIAQQVRRHQQTKAA